MMSGKPFKCWQPVGTRVQRHHNILQNVQFDTPCGEGRTPRTVMADKFYGRAWPHVFSSMTVDDRRTASPKKRCYSAANIEYPAPLPNSWQSHIHMFVYTSKTFSSHNRASMNVVLQKAIQFPLVFRIVLTKNLNINRK